MKRAIFLLVTGVIFFFSAQATVMADNDPPHSQASTVFCAECHGDELFSSGETGAALDALYDALCTKCHDDAMGTFTYFGNDIAPFVRNHDEIGDITGRFSDFSTRCIDCHNPHVQNMQYFYGRYVPSEMYLASGAGSVTVNDPVLSTITYSSLNLKSGWTVADLLAKTSEGRGAMFLPNYSSAYNSRVIVDINEGANTITVKGSVSSVNATNGFGIVYGQAINRFPTCDGCPIDSRPVPGNPVLYLDNTGTKSGAHNDTLAAGADSTPDGICQACHNRTNHWNKTPAMPADNHNSGLNCLSCHQHVNGFKANYVDHYSFSSPKVTDYVYDTPFDNPAGGPYPEPSTSDNVDLSCVSCHSSEVGAYKDGRDYVGSSRVHGGDCDHCHVDFASPPTMKVGDNGHGTALTDGTNSCRDCHGSPYDYDTLFGTAHANQDHSGLTATTTTPANSPPTKDCENCHDGWTTKQQMTLMVHGSNCSHCHTNVLGDGSLQDGWSLTFGYRPGEVSVGDATGHVLGTTSSCADCHTARYNDFSTHDHADSTYHTAWTNKNGTTDRTVLMDVTNDLSGTQNCNECHNSFNNQWESPNGIFILHLSSCATCHDSTRSNTTQPGTINTEAAPYNEASVLDVIANENYTEANPAPCLKCHYDRRNSHGSADHVGLSYVTAGATNCDNCHSGDVITSQFTHSGDCSNCHLGGDPASGLTGSATGHEGGPNTCVTCHDTYGGGGPGSFETGHQNPDHNSVTYSGGLAGVTECTSCHTNSDGGADGIATSQFIHNSDCTLCHTNTGSDGTLISGTDGDASGHLLGTTSDCLECHTDYATSFTGGHNDPNHTSATYGGGLVDTGKCADCHGAGSGDLVVTNTYTHNSDCTVCHTDTTNDGTLIAGVNGWGSAAGHNLGTTSSCADCHSSYDADFENHDNADHNSVTFGGGLVASANCSDCHGTGDGNSVVTNTYTHNSDCTVCHADTGPSGALIAGANGWGNADGHTLGTTSSCNDCHTDYTNFETGHKDADHNSVTYAGGLGDDANCSTCHGGDASAQDVVDDPYTHGSTCTLCHENTGADGTLKAAGTNGDASGHTLGTTSTCYDCHADYDSNQGGSFTGGHNNPDHNSVTYNGGLGETSSCVTCHTNSDGGADGIATSQLIHNSQCTLCHSNTTSNGTLIAGGNSNGTAADHNLGTTSLCADCHTAYAADFTAHDSGGSAAGHEDTNSFGGDGLIASTGSTPTTNCAACHPGSIATTEHDRSGTVASSCYNCHETTGTAASNGGVLIAGDTDASYDGTTSHGDATGHSLTGSSTCNSCHTAIAGDFINHDHGGLTNHNDSGAAGTTVAQVAADLSGTQNCNECHTTASSSLTFLADTWGTTRGLYALHLNDCATCHDSTRSNATQSGTIWTTNGDTSVQEVIANSVYTTGTPARCWVCHYDRRNVHGGHTATDFAWTSTGNNTQQTCGTADCHDYATNTNVVADVHNGRFAAAQTGGTNCENCHNDPSASDFTRILGRIDGDGDARNALNTSADCLVCHTKTYTEIHHATTLNTMTAETAQNGSCITCHKPRIDSTTSGLIVDRTTSSLGTSPATGTLAMPRELPCNLCHLYFAGFAADPNTNTGYVVSSSKVQIYANTFNPNTNFGRLQTATPVATHAVSENSTTPINDYGACFACHGQSAATDGGGFQVTPFHGLGTPYTTTNDDGSGVYDPGGTGETDLGGDIDDVTNAYSGPQTEMVWGENGSAGDANNPAKQVPYHPGWTNLNWLACQVGYNCNGSKPYGNDDSPGWRPDDLGLRDPTLPTPGNIGNCVSGNFDIPWDNFATGNPAAPQTIPGMDFGWKGTADVSTNFPTVPLALNGTNCPLPTNDPIDSRMGSGRNGTNKNGNLSLDGYAYVDHNAPYAASAPNNGTVTEVYFQKLDSDGDLTIFTCTPNTTPNPTSCTVTAVADYAVVDGVTEVVSLTIQPGDMIGYWQSGTASAVVDLSNNDPTPLGNGAIRRSPGAVNKPTTSGADSSFSLAPDPNGDFANMGATVNARPYPFP